METFLIEQDVNWNQATVDILKNYKFHQKSAETAAFVHCDLWPWLCVCV